MKGTGDVNGGGAATLLTRPRAGVVQITLNRPERMNALDGTLFDRLHKALDEIEGDAGCRVAVLTGAGRGFCAGGDMEQFGRFFDAASRGDVSAFWEYQRRGAELVPRLRRLPQPVVVAVNGPAVGGGLSLTAASDIRLAAEDTYFAAAGQRVGLSAADMGVGWLLPHLVGFGRAQELLLTGRRFSAQEALDYGLLARVLPADELLDAALDLAEELAAGPTFATRVTKEALWNILETPSQRAAMDMENRHQAMLIQGPEHREGVATFLRGEEPDYARVRSGRR